MTKKLFFSLLFGLFFFQLLVAQIENDSLSLKLNLNFGTVPLELNKNYISNSNDTLKLTLFKFYISGIEIEYDDKSKFVEQNSYHLIDIENLNSLKIPIDKKNEKTISNIKFNIGVDSLQSVSGALAGDLDLQNGMYWAWQSGYINMKIEGKSSSCKTRKNEFQFHIGGYLQPFYAVRTVNIICNIKNQINIEVDLGKLFSEINLKETNSIMIPSKKSMEIADLIAKIFSIE